MTNEHNFKVGDRVRLKGTDIEGTLKSIGTYYCHFVSSDGYITSVALGNIEPYDRRTAFLTRLQSLLKEHNATIQAYMSGVDTTGLCIYFADENVEEVDYKQNDTICEIDADNIMDFDKE